MTFTKYMKPTTGFKGKKHSAYSKMMMSLGQKAAHAKRRAKTPTSSPFHKLKK